MKSSKYTFFCENLSEKYLPEEESHHAIKVLRLKTGDKINVIDGKGKKIIASITETNQKKVSFEILEIFESIPPIKHIHIAIAPTKNMDRIEFFLEKVTEIGVNEISFFYAKNSERKILKLDRLNKIIVSAIKQSGNLYLPLIHPLKKYDEVIQNISKDYCKFIAHCEDDKDKNHFHNQIKDNKKFFVLIGPEGDFTNEEINLAKKQNFIPISLGDNILRTETAGIVVCNTIHVIN